MRRALKTLLLIALLLAVPLRAFAASGMLLCGPLSESHTTSPQSVESHDHNAHGDSGAHGSSAHAHGQSEDDAAHTDGTCSACGASCSAAVAAPATDIAPHIVQTSSLIAFLDIPFKGFTPDSADRPPLL